MSDKPDNTSNKKSLLNYFKLLSPLGLAEALAEVLVASSSASLVIDIGSLNSSVSVSLNNLIEQQSTDLSEEEKLRLKVGVYTQFLLRLKARRLLAISVIILFAIFGAIIYVFGLFLPIPLEVSAGISLIVGGASALSLLYIVYIQQPIGVIQDEFDVLRTKLRITEKLQIDYDDEGNSGSSAKYFDRLVEINVENLAEYYALVKRHNQNSFRAAMWAGIAGFGLVIFGIYIGLSEAENRDIVTLVATSSGIIINFIAGVFFILYNYTVRQQKDYHDSLVEVQNILLSFKIVDDLSDEDKKSQILMSMIGFLITKKPTSAQISVLPSTPDNPTSAG